MPIGTKAEVAAELEDVPSLLDRAARLWPDDEAVRFDLTGERLTFGQLQRRANAVAEQLTDLGIERGDRVALMLRNRAEFPITWLAALQIGAAMVPINTFAREADAGHILSHSGAGVMVTEPDFVGLVESLHFPGRERMPVVVADDSASGTGAWTNLLRRDEVSEQVRAECFGEETANIQYTSGTTGSPKGCMLSNRYWTVLSRLVVDDGPRLGKADVLITAQPFSYMDPQWNLLAGLWCGARVVVLDRFHPSSFWSKVVEHGGTFFYCLGSMPNLMARMPGSEHDRNHKVRYVACSAIPLGLHRELEERFGVPWFELFGSTETGGDIRMPPGEREDFVGTGCIGKPFSHREVRIVDDRTRPVDRGEVGEIVLRGHSMMDGYFRDRESTERAFRHGWFHTGDLGWMDSEGRVFFHGRQKDIIRRSGENVSAVEVETVVSQHSAVRLVACIPVPDDLRGEEIKALVVLQEDSAVSPEVLKQFCEERLAYFKVPRFWEFRDRLPLTASEKVAKAQLRDELGQSAGATWDASSEMWV